MLMRYSFFSIPEYNKFLTKLAVVNWNISNYHKFEPIDFSVQFIKRYFHVLWLDFVNQIQKKLPVSISVCFVQNRAYDKRLHSHLLRGKNFQ